MARRPPEENHSTCRFQRTLLVYGEWNQCGTQPDGNFLGILLVNCWAHILNFISENIQTVHIVKYQMARSTVL